ncbi:MAG: hypothetical protein ACO1SV_20400 [Fimbriimonas sp.]
MLNGNATLTRAKDGLSDIGVRARRGSHAVEDTAARIPSDAFLVAALASVGIALFCEITGRKQAANFVGHWAPTFLAFGLYNKISRAQRDMDY